ncbi:MAG: PAS domain S-box protein [Anaerolineales bacterium]
MMEIYPGIEQTDLFDALRCCMEDREAKRMENPFIFPDGNIGWFELSIQPAEEGIFILSTDITDRKQTEKYVLESERRYRDLVQNANSAIISWKRDGTIALFNEYAQSFFGYSPEEILGKNINILVPPMETTGGDLSKLVESIVEHPEQFVNVVNENVCRDGRRVWMTWTNKPTYDENGNVSEILAVGVDITERKRAEDALRQSQENFARAFNSNPAALAITHVKDGKFLIVNESYTDVMGYLPEEILGHSVAELNIYVNPEERNQLISQLREHGRVRNHELLVHSKSGEYKSLMVSMEPILYDKEESILSTFIDITEKKQVEEQIRQLNEDLEARVIERTSQLAAANKELESFSYSVSHDLRAPLRAIDGYTNILLEDYETILDEEGKRICGIISRETKRMGRLIDDLLSFSRMGRREIYFQRIDMKAMVDSVLDELLRGVDRSRFDIHVGDLQAVTGDSALLRQVWVNLLSNAIKFTSKKTRALIQVDSVESEEGVLYSVRDNGAGFEMEYANKLFGVFQRLHGESEFEGTGVGLAIVQRVIHRHDGRIWAESKVNEGTTFHFVLPQRND